MLPQIVWPVLVLAHAPRERALVDARRRVAVLQLAVLGHAALEPLRRALGAVAADVAARVRLDHLGGLLGLGFGNGGSGRRGGGRGTRVHAIEGEGRADSKAVDEFVKVVEEGGGVGRLVEFREELLDELDAGLVVSVASGGARVVELVDLVAQVPDAGGVLDEELFRGHRVLLIVSLGSGGIGSCKHTLPADSSSTSTLRTLVTVPLLAWSQIRLSLCWSSPA